MDQFNRDVLHLLRFSLLHPPEAAPVLFPMFTREQIRQLYAIPLATRRKVWENRADPAYRAMFSEPPYPPGPGE